MKLRPARAVGFRGVVVIRNYICRGSDFCRFLAWIFEFVRWVCLCGYTRIKIFFVGMRVGMSFFLTVLIVVPCNSKFLSHRGWVC